MELTIAIIAAILRYGPSAIVAIAPLFSGDKTPTAEEIRALKIEKEPEDYFSR